MVEFDTHTGFTRVLFEETSDTFVKLNQSAADLPMFLPLPSSEELIWFSERTDWGHLYLYNLNTGELKHQITGVSSSGDNGEWLVRNILHYDIERREILLRTCILPQPPPLIQPPLIAGRQLHRKTQSPMDLLPQQLALC